MRHLREKRTRHAEDHRDQVDDAGEPRLRANGDLKRREPALQALLERLERAEEVGALPVEAVDHDHAREAVLVGELPDLLGLDLDAGDRYSRNALGFLRLVASDFREAEEVFRQVLDVRSDDDYALLHLAKALLGTRRTDEAKGVLRRVLDLGESGAYHEQARELYEHL